MPISNRLLSALSQETRDQILSLSTAIPLPVRTVLFEPEQIPKYAYFMTSGIASVVTPMLDGGTAEVEIIGWEGLVGSLYLLGSAPAPTRCFVQLPGTALRIELTVLRKLFHNSAEIRSRILEFVQVQALTVSQMAGCNRLHEAEARLARWLLMVQDRTQSEALTFTQIFLAEMLGTQRTTVTTTAGALQRAGLIRYRPSEVRILDREGMEAAACDCYRIAKTIYAGLYLDRAN